jgi:ribosomal-protein-alanine N-acetyltransferase
VFRNVTLDGGLVWLRNYRPDDADAIYAVGSDERVLKYMPPSDRMTRSAWASCLAWQIACYDTNTPHSIKKFVLALELKSTHRPVGWCGLGPWDVDESRIELFYGLDPSLWGQGIATCAVRVLLRYGLDVIGLAEVVGSVQPGNAASRRVLEKTGLHYRGIVQNAPPGAEWYNGEVWYSTRPSPERGPDGRLAAVAPQTAGGHA